MKHISHSTMITAYMVVVFYSHVTLSVSLRLSGAIKDDPHFKDTLQKVISTDITKGQFRKRGCDGFPCMYSHLGTKAAQASLYNTLAGFIDDCFNDPECDPGRRKRDNTNRIRALINTPLSKLHIYGAKASRLHS